LPFILILLIFGVALGVLVSALIFRLGPSAEWIAWPIPFFLSIFSSVYYPVSTMPVALQLIAKLVPASYVFESMRTILSTNSFSSSIGLNLAIGLLLSLIYSYVTYRLFIRVYRHNLNTGGIARFSAEG